MYLNKKNGKHIFGLCELYKKYDDKLFKNQKSNYSIVPSMVYATIIFNNLP